MSAQINRFQIVSRNCNFLGRKITRKESNGSFPPFLTQNGNFRYINKFTKNQVVFEKSATYFDNPEAAKQAFALVPEATILVILYDPAKRSYSWYQVGVKIHFTKPYQNGTTILAYESPQWYSSCEFEKFWGDSG